MTTVMTWVDMLIILDLKPDSTLIINTAYKIWNNLPESIVNATSITQFKCKLKQFNLYQIFSLVFAND